MTIDIPFPGFRMAVGPFQLSVTLFTSASVFASDFPHFLGSAKIVDPGGAVLARTGAREGVAVAEVDPAAVREARLGIDHLADRRPDAYAAPVPAAAALGFAR